MALPPPGCVTSGEGLNLPESPHSLFSDLCFCTHLPGEGLSFEAGPRRPCPPMEPGPSFSLRYCFITPLVPLYHPSRTSKQKPTGGGSGRPGVSQGVGGWGETASPAHSCHTSEATTDLHAGSKTVLCGALFSLLNYILLRRRLTLGPWRSWM